MLTGAHATRVRTAVVGCGNHSLTSLQPCIPLVPALDYVAACDLDLRRAAAGQRFGARRCYQDFRRMFEKEELDAVIVVGPATMNYEVALAGADAGLHVFVEKPSAPTVDGARHLADAVRARGTIGMVGTMWRHAPAVRAQRHLLDTEGFGSATAFQGIHVAPGYHVDGPGGAGGLSIAWRFMLDQGCHMADCARFLMGPVRSVIAVASATPGRDDRVCISTVLTFASGAAGTILYASHATVMSPTLTVVGASGRVATVRTLTALHLYPLPHDLGEERLRAHTSRTWEHGANYRGISRPGYLEELESFARAICSGTPADPSLDDGWRALQLCQAVLDSAASNAPVSLNQTS